MSLVPRMMAHQRLRKRMEALRPDLYRLAYSWCQDAQLADDLVQDCMERGLKRIDQLKDHDQLKAWLARILSNLHVDFRRRNRETVQFDENMAPASGYADWDGARSRLIHQTRHAVDQLNEDQRKTLTLVDLMGFSYAEVAEVLEVPVGTVMSRLHRARNNLKTMLAPEARPEASAEGEQPAMRPRRVK